MSQKITFVISTLTNGGAERTVSIWANELYRRGYDVSIVLFHRSNDEYELDSNIPIFALANDRASYKKMNSFKQYFALRRIFKRIDPNYIISFLPSPQAWVMITTIGLKAKRVDTLRNNPHHGKVHNNLFYRWAWRLCFLTADKIILQSKDQLIFFGKKEQKKAVIIPNQVAECFLENVTINKPKHPTRFIAVGRFFPQKNYKMMIDAFAIACSKHSDIQLQIFGKGDTESVSEVQKWIYDAHMQNNIHIMGWSSDLLKEYQNCDVFLMSSNYEGLPNALMEAMSQGLICIATDCETGPRDLIDNNESGFLVPVGDSARFADAINRVIEMPADERLAMSQAARDSIVEKCSQKVSIDKLCECFKE